MVEIAIWRPGNPLSETLKFGSRLTLAPIESLKLPHCISRPLAAVQSSRLAVERLSSAMEQGRYWIALFGEADEHAGVERELG